MKLSGKLTLAEIQEITSNLENMKYKLTTQSSMVDIIIETDEPTIINRLISKGLKEWNT